MLNNLALAGVMFKVEMLEPVVKIDKCSQYIVRGLESYMLAANRHLSCNGVFKLEQHRRPDMA